MDGYEIGDDPGSPTGKCASCGRYYVQREDVIAADYMPPDRCSRCVEAGFSASDEHVY